MNDPLFRQTKRRSAILVVLAIVSVGAALLWWQSRPPSESYDPEASVEEIRRWERELEERRDWLASPLVDPAPSGAEVAGDYVFSRYNYRIRVDEDGEVVRLVSEGLDKQVGGGAWWAVGSGPLEGDRARISWDCVDLSRSFANGGGALLTFSGDRLEALYYHDTQPSLLEWGEGRRLDADAPHPPEGAHRGRVPYSPRIPDPPEGGFRFHGIVQTPEGAPIPDARVQLKGVERSATMTDAEGRFTIFAPSFENVRRFTAGKPGWRNGQLALYAGIDPPDTTIQIVLEPLPIEDHVSYRWIAPDPVEDPKNARELFACGNCHRRQHEGWQLSRHAQSALNPFVQRSYREDFLPAIEAGTSSVGHEGGACAACHSPSAWAASQSGSDEDPMLSVAGVDARGNHCDFCHKIRHVERPDLNGLKGSLILGRPNPEAEEVPGPVQRVYGSLSDVTYRFMGASYSPVFRTSWLCAGCHESARSPAGLAKLETFTEWRRATAGRPDAPSCQGCHMPGDPDPNEDEIAIWAMDRGPDQLKDHRFRGLDPDWVRSAIRFEVRSQRHGGRVSVEVELENIGADHKIPTGTSSKHLLLVVVPLDTDGRPLDRTAISGGTLPAHAGSSDQPLATRLTTGRYAGLSGATFDRHLAEASSTDPVPWWRASRELWDRRLEPGVTVERAFEFADPSREIASFELRLIHRRVRASEWHRHGFEKSTGEAPAGRPIDVEISRRTVPVRS